MPTPQLLHETVPARQGTAPHPLLLLLHGRGANEFDLLPLASELDPRLFVVSARAPLERGGGYHWYDLEGIGKPEPVSYAKSLALLGTFLTDVIATYPVDPSNAYAAGFSQGAMMTGSLLLTNADRLAGAVLFSGYLPDPATLTPHLEGVKGKPVFWGHGTGDAVLSIDFGRAGRDVLLAAGAVLTYREYPMAHQISNKELVDAATWLTEQLDARTAAKK